MTIDALAASQTLRKNGFTEEQAAGVVEVLREIDSSVLATKADLKTEITDATSDILKWISGQTLVVLGALFAMVKLTGIGY